MCRLNFFTNNKFLDFSKLKVLADDKINVTEKLKLFWEGWEALWEWRKCCVTSISPFRNFFFLKGFF